MSSNRKVIKLDDAKLRKLLTEKADLVTKGRAKSDEITEFEKRMEEINKLILDEEKKVDTTDLDEKAKAITETVNVAIKDMGAIKNEVFSRMKAQVPPALGEEYDALKKRKEQAENDRNKLALKAQKYNYKLIPLGRKLMKPFLEDEYDDYETIQIENDEIVATIFNHMNDFKANFAKKKK